MCVWQQHYLAEENYSSPNQPLREPSCSELAIFQLHTYGQETMEELF